MSSFPETILLTTQKNLCTHTRTYISAKWTLILQDKTLKVQSQSHQRLKAQFITVVSGNSIRDIFFKMKQFKAYLSEVKITNSFHVETSQLVCFANHLIGFYMI